VETLDAREGPLGLFFRHLNRPETEGARSIDLAGLTL
jgi:hypothetical protein